MDSEKIIKLFESSVFEAPDFIHALVIYLQDFTVIKYIAVKIVQYTAVIHYKSTSLLKTNWNNKRKVMKEIWLRHQDSNLEPND